MNEESRCSFSACPWLESNSNFSLVLEHYFFKIPVYTENQLSLPASWTTANTGFLDFLLTSSKPAIVELTRFQYVSHCNKSPFLIETDSLNKFCSFNTQQEKKFTCLLSQKRKKRLSHWDNFNCLRNIHISIGIEIVYFKQSPRKEWLLFSSESSHMQSMPGN